MGLYRRSSRDEEEEEEDQDSCIVFWNTKSILPPPIPSTSTSTSTSRVPPPPALPKRNSTSASLPSPSSSSIKSTGGGGTRKPPSRFSKRRKPEPSSQVLDESTMKTLGALSARLNARSTSSAPAVLAQPTGMRQVLPPPTRATRSSAAILTSTSTNRPSHTTLPSHPLTRTSKPFSPPVHASTSLPPNSKPSPLSTTSSSKSPPHLPLPLPPATATVSAIDEFDSFLSGDDSFEMALSQMEEPPSSSATAQQHVVVAPPTPTPPSRGAGVGGGAVGKGKMLSPLKGKGKQQPFRTTTTSSTRVQPTNIINKPFSFSTTTTTTGPALIKSIKPKPPLSSQSSNSGLVIGRKVTSEKERRALEELAKKEMEGLMEGAEDWSDVEEDF